MKNPLLAVPLAVITTLAAWSAAAEGPSPGWVHPGNEAISEEGYSGADTCTACHPDALREITHSVHWYAASKVHGVRGLPDGTWWGMVDRECALAGSTALANWTAATDGHFTPQSAGCGMCHIAALPAPPLPAGREATPAEAATVDCLVCHAASYDMSVRKTVVTGPDGQRRWGQDRSKKAALSITRVPTAEACLRCHEHSFSADYKRGTPFEADNDVHAAAGLTCVDCHVTRHHLIAKGQWESDMVANDLPDVAVECSGCHGSSPHRGGLAAELNDHVATIACQTCHVSAVSGVVAEDWGRPVADDGHGRYSALSWFDPIPAIKGLQVPTVTIRGGTPDHIWRVPNDGSHSAAQSWMAFATASRTSDGAKILPVRALKQILLFDTEMKMHQAPGMGFLSDDPKMKDFPLLLAPDREVYTETGDIGRAIAAGVAKGKAMGLTWSGHWTSMEVPGTSYISVSHAVRRIGLNCESCHSPHGVLDFAALGYSKAETATLQGLLADSH